MLLPDIRAVYGSEFFVFLQYIAPSYRARHSSAVGRDTKDFIPPALRPHNSPEVNPVDLAVLSVLQQLVYRTKISDVDELKRYLYHDPLPDSYLLHCV